MSPAPLAPQCCAQGLAANTQPTAQSWMTARLSRPAWGQGLMARAGDGRDPVGLLGKVCRGLVAKGNIWWISTLLEKQGLVKWSSSEKHLKDLTGKLLLVTAALECWSPSEHAMPSYARTLIYLSMDWIPKYLFIFLFSGKAGRADQWQQWEYW